MSDEKRLSDPTNRVVCIFDDHATAVTAKAALLEYGFEKSEVKLLQGDEGAAEIDTSAKWFADTDKQLKNFARELRNGATLLSVPVKDCDCRGEVNELVRKHGARRVTHFGEWVTELMR